MIPSPALMRAAEGRPVLAKLVTGGSDITSNDAHVPVLLQPILRAVAPVEGIWLDGTFGAGGYTRGLLEAGASKVIAVDRDPSVFEMAADWAGQYGERLALCEGRFSALDELSPEPLAGVVLDVGVSSMQLDQAPRGFSFMRDGPLDMRMSSDGLSAADIVNRAPEAALADILFHYGEERAARRITRAILKRRAEAPLETTRDLARLVEDCLPPPRPGQVHPATRTFQALRIAVNDELGELAEALMAAERALAPGGWLVVVTFHSLEDRIVKRFLRSRSGAEPRGSRHHPESAVSVAGFKIVTRKARMADEDEADSNPRARSAKLRIARRTDAPAEPVERAKLGVPVIKSFQTEGFRA